MINEKVTIIDRWHRAYSYIIPTVAVAIYIICQILIGKGILAHFDITGSKNFTDMLDSLITFVTIVLGVFGFLLPILITNKKDCGLINRFLDNIDKKEFTFCLKLIISSGFLVVILTGILYLNDILGKMFLLIAIGVDLWVVLFFMSSSFRFISILLEVMLSDNSETSGKVLNAMDKAEEKEMTDKFRNRGGLL